MSKRKPLPISDEEEAEVQRMIASDPDDWNSSEEELADARPFAEVFPELMASIERARGQSQIAEPKQAVTLRLRPDTLAKFKAAGEDWRARMVEALDRAEL